MKFLFIALVIFISILIFTIINKLFKVVYLSVKGLLIEIISIVIISIFCTIIILGKLGDMFYGNKEDIQANNMEYYDEDIKDDKNENIKNEVENKRESFHNKIKSGNANINDLVEANSGFYNSFSATKFEDNVAWIKNIGNYYCIDTTGKVLFFLEKINFDNSISVTNFSNGISVINNSYIIDKSGNIISSIEDGDYDEIILQGEYLDKIYNGLVFVKKNIETFDKNETLIGVIGNDGTFKKELSDKIKSADYVGDGLYYIAYNNNENIYLDSKDMNIYTDSELDFFSNYYIRNNISYMDGQEWFFFENNGIYGDKYMGIGFFNKFGEKVLDLSEYSNLDKNIENQPYFVGEYCVLLVSKKDNTKWLTVINKLGKRMFEPIKLNDNDYIGKLSDGLIRVSNNRTHYFIDVFGKTVIDKINADYVTDFNNELSMIKTDNGYYYINTKGIKVLSLEQNIK